jgi:hypothetical protein
MLADAIKAKLPVIAVQTDDPLHADVVLQSIAKKPVVDMSVTGDKGVLISNNVYMTQDEKVATAHNYARFTKAGTSLVVVNPAKITPVMFDGGMLMVPEVLMNEHLSFIQKEQRQPILQVVKGMSLKSAAECVNLTIARTGGYKPSEVRRTRLSLTGGLRGLIPLETEEEVLYVWPSAVLEWLDTNQKFFESPSTPHKLVPRGLLLDGPAGVGKTMLAREVAHRLKIPLYRVDIAQALNRWQGESETQVVRILALAEQEAPCVVLFDEVEKIFTHSDDSGVVTRILATLLWWLAEHRSRVLTVMTTNNVKKIPPELYRPGRLDKVFYLPELQVATQGVSFCSAVYRDIMGEEPSYVIKGMFSTALGQLGKMTISHGAAAELVYDMLKSNNWVAV